MLFLSKIFLVDLPEGLGFRGLAGYGKILKFSPTGVCVAEMPFTLTGIYNPREVDIISILQSDDGKSAELAFHINQVFTKKPIRDMSIAWNVNQILSFPGSVFMAHRFGNIQGYPYRQYFFAFQPEVLVLEDLLTYLG